MKTELLVARTQGRQTTTGTSCTILEDIVEGGIAVPEGCDVEQVHMVSFHAGFQVLKVY
jgi:hypothetical protein